MKKTFQIIMLPAEKAPRTYMGEGFLLETFRDHATHRIIKEVLTTYYENIGPHKAQYLYILSEDEIKEDDWCISGKEVFQCKTNEHKGIFKKIVATTDKSLTAGINNCDGCLANKPIDNNGNHRMGNEDKYPDYMSCQKSKYIINLPQLPESFIQAYIKAYNEGKPITEVDLEMEKVFGVLTPDFTDEIKTRSDNTVIVHQSKMYSRDEVISLLNKCWYDSAALGGSDNDCMSIENWIKENL